MGNGVITDVNRTPSRASASTFGVAWPEVAVTTQVVGAAGVDADQHDVADFFAGPPARLKLPHPPSDGNGRDDEGEQG